MNPLISSVQRVSLWIIHQHIKGHFTELRTSALTWLLTNAERHSHTATLQTSIGCIHAKMSQISVE